jgi:hypothetical protein
VTACPCSWVYTNSNKRNGSKDPKGKKDQHNEDAGRTDIVNSNTVSVLLRFSLKILRVPRVQNVIMAIIKRSTFSYL